jgi:hypothetical protein
MIEQKYIDRFHTKYVKKENGCWEWIGGKNRDGYGRFYDGFKTSLAHRVSALIYGLDLTKPEVRHICHNPACVCPDHLIMGTHQDNINDMKEANRQPIGIKNGMTTLTEKQALYIKKHYIPNINSMMLAKQFNVTDHTIRNIAKGRTWKHL